MNFKAKLHFLLTSLLILNSCRPEDIPQQVSSESSDSFVNIVTQLNGWQEVLLTDTIRLPNGAIQDGAELIWVHERQDGQVDLVTDIRHISRVGNISLGIKTPYRIRFNNASNYQVTELNEHFKRSTVSILFEYYRILGISQEGDAEDDLRVINTIPKLYRMTPKGMQTPVESEVSWRAGFIGQIFCSSLRQGAEFASVLTAFYALNSPLGWGTDMGSFESLFVGFDGTNALIVAIDPVVPDTIRLFSLKQDPLNPEIGVRDEIKKIAYSDIMEGLGNNVFMLQQQDNTDKVLSLIGDDKGMHLLEFDKTRHTFQTCWKNKPIATVIRGDFSRGKIAIQRGEDIFLIDSLGNESRIASPKFKEHSLSKVSETFYRRNALWRVVCEYNSGSPHFRIRILKREL